MREVNPLKQLNPTGKFMEKYNEKYRPQFHFTAEKGWLNDPNGLVFYDGQYHLFFQHNPFGTKWGNMTWGHAVSSDLVHWEQLPNALEPDAMGTMFSGSAVVDWENSAGFQTGNEKTLVAIYTAEGACVTPKAPTTQCIAFSNDKGMNWTKYSGNPVISEISPGNRDPKVFRFSSGKGAGDSRWIMALYVDEGGQTSSRIHSIQFFSSKDLKKWKYMSKVEGFYECPDFFELPVDENPKNRKWVLFGADSRYMIGSFDGGQFVPETAKHTGDWGPGYYAAQTYSDVPETDGRRILIGWMRGGNYPDMPFSQQMGFPCELTLQTFPEGIRLCKYPVMEIESLYEKTLEKSGIAVKPGENPLADVQGELFDIDAEILAGSSSEFGFDIRGQKISYVVGDEDLIFNFACTRLPLVDGKIKLRILVDRTSFEIFGNGGRVSISSFKLLDPENRTLGFYSSTGTAELAKIRISSLNSSWR
jgi:sucrose-6-phosphate hydrolase SacC (GH32 family)